MKLDEISFDDEAFKKAVYASGATEAEEVTEIRGRRQQIGSTAGLQYFPNLRVLDLTRNRINRIDLSGNPRLEQLFIGNNQLEQLDLSGLDALEGLEVFMNDLETLDLSHNPKLEVLYANANDFAALDLSNNPLLDDVQLNDNSLKQLALAESLQPSSFSARNNLFDEAQISDLKSRLADCSPLL